jgi:hypothetical protein
MAAIQVQGQNNHNERTMKVDSYEAMHDEWSCSRQGADLKWGCIMSLNLQKVIFDLRTGLPRVAPP